MDVQIPAAIITAYALEHASVIEQFESYGNENWLVEDGHGRRCVLRRHTLNADLNRIEFQLALQQHLIDHRIPSSDVIATRSGDRVAIDDDGVPWVLFTHVAGQEYDFGRAEQAVEAARSLARFHLVMESFFGEAPGPEYKAPIRDCWANVSRDLAELGELLESDGAREESAYLGGWWRSVLDVWPVERIDALPSGWMHGDFHGRNMVFDGHRLAGLFDFDDVDRGPYAYDLANGVFRFGRGGRGSLHIRPAFARVFLEGYAAVRPISAEERAVLPVMVAMGCPPHPQNYRWWRARGEDIERRFCREVGTIRLLRAEVERIGSLVFG